MHKATQRQAFQLQIKSVDAAGRFAGYASVFDIVDSQKDVVKRGAFRKSLAEITRKVKLLWQHRQDEPIGELTTLFEDVRGLYVEGTLFLSVKRAQEAYVLLQRGAVNGLSIGYTPVKYRIEPKSGVRILSEVNLWEVSLVTFPANEAAQVTVVKSQPLYAGLRMEKPDDGCLEDERLLKQASGNGQILKLMEALERAAIILAV